MENVINATETLIATVSNEQSDTAITKEKAIETLKTIVSEKANWEKTAYKTSNEMLYGLLQRCYIFYNQMCANTSEGQATREGLEAYISQKGYVFTKSTHNITKIVKCVFGADRRRVNAYSIALRRALAENVGAMDIVGFIIKNGGVEELRLPKSNSMTPKQKAEQGGFAIGSQYLGKFKTAELSRKIDASKVNSQHVLIVTQCADGEFIVNALVEGKSALDAALAAFYTKNIKAAEVTAKTNIALQPQQASAAAVQVAVEKLAA